MNVSVDLSSLKKTSAVVLIRSILEILHGNFGTLIIVPGWIACSTKVVSICFAAAFAFSWDIRHEIAVMVMMVVVVMMVVPVIVAVRRDEEAVLHRRGNQRAAEKRE